MGAPSPESMQLYWEPWYFSAEIFCVKCGGTTIIAGYIFQQMMMQKMAAQELLLRCIALYHAIAF